MARFRDSPNFPPAEKESESARGRERGSSRLRPRPRRVPSRGEREKVSNGGAGRERGEREEVRAWRIAGQISVESRERIFAFFHEERDEKYPPIVRPMLR